MGSPNMIVKLVILFGLQKENNMFKSGDTVIFDKDSFTKEFWNGLTEEAKVEYYGRYGYETIYWPGQTCRVKLFTFICEHSPQTGHCVLMDMDDGKLLPMCHTNNFKLATEDEC